jgi:hypothetical protein
VRPLRLVSISMSPAPRNIPLGDLRFDVSKAGRDALLTWQPTGAEGLGEAARVVEMSCDALVVAGDVKVAFYVREAKHKLVHFWFNTRFVTNNQLTLRLADLDDASKDKVID